MLNVTPKQIIVEVVEEYLVLHFSRKLVNEMKDCLFSPLIFGEDEGGAMFEHDYHVGLNFSVTIKKRPGFVFTYCWKGKDFTAPTAEEVATFLKVHDLIN